MPLTIPPLLSPWRSTDRLIVLKYANWPASNYNVSQLTQAMNRVADTLPDQVTQIQGWIDQAERLEQDWEDQIEDGTAHIGNAAEYEGPRPGATITQDDRQVKLDVIEWAPHPDLKIRTVTGGRADATAGGLTQGLITKLRLQVLQSIGIQAAPNLSGGGTRVVRS
jgi:hypothetical protein